MRLTRRAILTACLCGAASLLNSGVAWYAVRSVKGWRPLVYRIDERHEAVAEHYSVAAEDWRETDARKDLEDFVRYHYTRNRETIESLTYGFPRSIWYMSEPLAMRAKQSSTLVNQGGCSDPNGERCTVMTYVSDRTSLDVSVRIVRTKLEDFQPVGQWRASTTFWRDSKLFGGEIKSVLSTLDVQAEYLEKVPPDYLPTDRNPRGLVIDSMELKSGTGDD
jgi:hypothetical protein